MTKITEKYLVTGGAGFIGSHLVRRLVAEGKTVRVVDNLSTGQVSRLADLITAIEFLEGDLADERVSQDAVNEIDYVLHQAAVPSVQRSVQDPSGYESGKHHCYFESFGELPKSGSASAGLCGFIVGLRRHRDSS